MLGYKTTYKIWWLKREWTEKRQGWWNKWTSLAAFNWPNCLQTMLNQSHLDKSNLWCPDASIILYLKLSPPFLFVFPFVANSSSKVWSHFWWPFLCTRQWDTAWIHCVWKVSFSAFSCFGVKCCHFTDLISHLVSVFFPPIVFHTSNFSYICISPKNSWHLVSP